MVTINSAEGNRASIRYMKEAVWGETPASGNTYEARILKSSLTRAKTTQVSKEIRADRMVPNIQETGASAAGSVDFEFSAGSLDPFLEGFLLGTWSRAMNFWQVKGRSVAVTGAGQVTISGKDWRAYLTVGQYIKLEGFQTEANNTYVKVTVAALTGGNTVLTVTGATLVAEVGSGTTKVFDASDVILKSTTLTVAATNKLHDGTNAFTAGLVPGQKLYVEGLGKESGDIVVDATDAPNGSTITVSDGVDTVVFEMNVSASACAPGNVFILNNGTPATLAVSIAAAVNAQFAAAVLRVTASAATDTVTLVNHRQVGGAIVCSDEGTSLTSTDFAGGDASLAGIVTVSAVVDANNVIVEENITTNTNAGTLPVILKGSHLQNPGAANIVKQSFSIETGFTDVSKFFLATGQRVGSFDLDVKAGDLVTGSVDLKGRSIVQSNTETLGLTPYVPLDSTSTEILNATSNVGSIKKDGVVLDLAIMEISLKGDSNLREQRAVGERFPAGIGYGRFNLTGKFTAYFESFELYDAFINHTTVGLGFDFTDVDQNHYEFQIPAVKFTADPIVPDGIDTDVMEKIDWTAQRDPVLNAMMLVDRFSSIYPFAS